MSKADRDYKKSLTKEFWKFLSTERLKPSTKPELRQVYYEQFKKTLAQSSCTVPFSTIMFQLKRMKKVVKSKDQSETLIYFERKGRRLVLAVDQSFIQRKKRHASKEKEDNDKDVDEAEKEKELQDQNDHVEQLKKLFIENKWEVTIIFNINFFTLGITKDLTLDIFSKITNWGKLKNNKK